MAELDPMVAGIVRDLTRRVLDHEDRIRSLARGSQARHRSVEGGAQVLYDEDDELRAIVGELEDGSYGITTYGGAAPPAPSVPLVTSIPGGATITWDGFDANDEQGWPDNFARVRIHQSTIPDDPPDTENTVGSFDSPAGGALTIAHPADVTTFVYFVAVTTAGVESVPSAEVEVVGGEADAGPPGPSAYDVAVAAGFVGTEAEWLASLEGAAGDPGGPGPEGDPGPSAYELAVANGFVGTEAAWLASLEGPAGADAPPVPGQTFDPNPPPDDVTGLVAGHAWWQIKDRLDADGVVVGKNVVGFWRLEGGAWASQDVVNVEALHANDALIEALTGKTFTGATMQTRAADERGIKLGTVAGIEGLFVYDDLGNVFLKAVPAEGMAILNAILKALNLTVSDGSSLGGITELTRAPDGSAGGIRMTGYTTAPKSAPTVTTGYATVQFDDDGLWATRRGWATDGAGFWYTTRRIAVGQPRYLVEKWAADGTLADEAPTTAIGSPYGCVVYGAFVYVLTDAVDEVDVRNLADLSYVSSHGWTHYAGAERTIGLDAAAGHLLLAKPRTDRDDKVTIERFALPLPAGALVPFDFEETDFGYNRDLAGVTYGAHDFGGNRYVFTSDLAHGYRVVSAVGAAMTDEDWEAAESGKVGFTYTGGAFVSMDTAGKMRTYTGEGKALPIGHVDLTKWVSNDLARLNREVTITANGTTTITAPAGSFVAADAAGAGSPITGAGIPGGTVIAAYVNSGQVTLSANAAAGNPVATITRTLATPQSPRAKIAMPKRSRVTVKTSEINTGGANAPDRVRIYVGKGAADPGIGGMWKQTDPAAGVITRTYSSLLTAGTNPVATNGFLVAAGTVQGVQFADESWFIDGVGGPPHKTDWVPTWTATTAPALGDGTLLGRYQRLAGNTYMFQIQLTIGATTTFGTGAWRFDFPVTELARRWTFSGAAFDTSAGQHWAVTGVRTGSDLIRVMCDPTAAGAQMRDVTGTVPFAWGPGDVLFLSGTFEIA